MKTRQTVLRFVIACPLLMAACFAAEPIDRPGFDAPAYTDDGSLRRPSGFRNWVFVGASLGLSYSPSKGGYEKQLFHNVYLDRRSYQAYAETGAFPERSMLAMAASKD